MLQMTPEAFEAFYAATARPLKAYLLRLVGNAALADELLQESYLRMLKSGGSQEFNDRERKAYLFRIATNLVTDQHRGKREKSLPIPEGMDVPAVTGHPAMGDDVHKALDRLQPRERELVWLAYVEGSSHREIAEILGVREVSIRPMLFRAKQKLLELLKAIGYEQTVRI
jgi:RNA polymerase sigma-70 factor (ECF subfamily)